MPQPEQRPVKFRLAITSPHWDENPGCTKLSKPLTLEQIIDHEQIDFTDGGYLDWDDIDWETDTVRYLQFTGLHDKNGDEIYEGDICEAFKPNSYLGGIYEVAWHDEKGRWYYKNQPTFKDPYQVGAASGRISCVVIGNIYQNPELLTHAQT